MKETTTSGAEGCQSWDLVKAALDREATQKALALELGWPESKISELKPKLRDGCILLESLGLKVVPSDLEVFEAKTISALLSTLQATLPHVTVDQLRKMER